MPGTPNSQPRVPMSVFIVEPKSAWINIRFVCIGTACLSAAILLSLFALNLSDVLKSIGHAWAVSDPLRHADAAVILGGGFDTRPAAAAKLYQAGDVRKILVSTAEPESREVLVKLGIPAAAMIAFGDNPSSTYEEARALALWAQQNDIHRLIIPTEIFSSRRVQWILRQELSKIHVDVRIETMPPISYNFNNWWQHANGLFDFRTEITKYLYYRIRYWHS
jgi:uncharacterized SAM-binding protein YcdF (DUF218 family)